MNLKEVKSVELDGIDVKDYPDFVDAYITYAEYYGEEMTEEQLDELNENTEFIHESVMSYLY